MMAPLMVPLMVPVMVPVMAAAAAVAAVGPEAPLVEVAAVPERRALIMGCKDEVREQLVLMLDLMGWTARAVDTPARLIAALQRQAAAQALDLLFVDAGRIAEGGFAINRSRTVVFLGRAPNHGRALFAGKTIIWLDTPLDIVKLERVIVNAV